MVKYATQRVRQFSFPPTIPRRCLLFLFLFLRKGVRKLIALSRFLSSYPSIFNFQLPTVHSIAFVDVCF